MVRIYGWVEKSVASGKSIVELDRRVFFFFFFFYNDIESIVSFFFLREWTGRGISLRRGEFMGTGFSMARNYIIRWKIDKIVDRIYFGGR